MSELSEKILAISTPYLGPAAKVFLERQTKVHMGGIPFDQLRNTDLPELIKWIKISAGLIIDKTKAEEFAGKVAKAT